jgi:rsbT co-antagonist protein RsbR
MSMSTAGRLATVLNQHHSSLLESWLQGMLSRLVRRDKTGEAEVRTRAARFLPLVADALAKQDGTDINTAAWGDVRQLLAELSATRVRQGYTPIETATFVFSLKDPLGAVLRQELTDAAELVDATTLAGNLFDQLGLYTIEEFTKSREQVILRQQQELLELSTPVVQLWKDVLALPLIGTLDSARTQVVMENLLQKIIDTGASIAIIDITGVPTVDTLVAQHLLKTVAAARLMGADCIISGIRPQIAQTIVHLGVNLEDVITKASLADAFLVALKRTGATVNYAAKAA